MSERLAALRQYLASHGIDAFIVPRADEHQGEYVAPSSERLAWLTGFHGSAGTAVVTADDAALFVDGRYTLEAATLTAGTLWQALPSGDILPSDWLAKVLKPKQVVGLDPWLHTPEQVVRWKAAATKAGATLRFVEQNPIDALWADRPPLPMAPVVPHALEFAGETAESKRLRHAESLKTEGIAAIVLSAPESVAWLLNVRGGDVPYAPMPLGFAILHDDATVDLVMASAKLSAETRAFLGKAVQIVEPSGFAGLLSGFAGKTVAVCRATGAAWIAETLQTHGATAKVMDDPTALSRARKNTVELNGARSAHVRDGVALVRFLAWLDRTVPTATLSEITAADKLEAFRREGQYFKDLSFPTISGAGPNGAIVHYRVSPASNRPLRSDDVYLVDSGAQYLDGTTDVTRTVIVGAPSDEVRRRYTQVLKGHIALGSAVFPAGTTGSQLDVLARRALWLDGVDYDHGTGHGVGSYLSVHEGPQRISKHPNSIALDPGMIVSNEPGYYKTGAYGIRIEALVAVVEATPPPGSERRLLAFETLTQAPYERRLIDISLLDSVERQWIDRYHAGVYNILAPFLADDDRAWLKAAVAPL